MHKSLQKIYSSVIVRAVFALGLAVGLASLSIAPVSASAITVKPGLGVCADLLEFQGGIPVSLAKGQPYNKKLSATYCQPFKWTPNAPHQVDVLTAGASYTKSYWDWPVKASAYSYVDKTLNAGRGVVIYDRIGSGESAKKSLSTEITLDSDAYVLHQIVQVVRIFGVQVNSIGHSYGSGVVLQEAKQYHDVNRVVVTGYLHDPRNPAVAVNNYPANQDPKFAASGFDNGYLTSKPNTRKASFYNAATADQDVVNADEAQKDVISLTAFLGYAAQQGAPVATNISKEIHVPVMAVVGQQDLIFCSNPAVLDCSNTAAVRAYEAPFYAGAPVFKAYVVADTAHDVALHPSAQTSFNAIDAWLKNPTN